MEFIAILTGRGDIVTDGVIIYYGENNFEENRENFQPDNDQNIPIPANNPDNVYEGNDQNADDANIEHENVGQIVPENEQNIAIPDNGQENPNQNGEDLVAINDQEIAPEVGPEHNVINDNIVPEVGRNPEGPGKYIENCLKTI